MCVCACAGVRLCVRARVRVGLVPGIFQRYRELQHGITEGFPGAGHAHRFGQVKISETPTGREGGGALNHSVQKQYLEVVDGSKSDS